MKKTTQIVCAGFILFLSFTNMAQASSRNKLVFISDLHMNIDAPFAWLQTNAPALASFINTVNAREDVSELVILGDLLDDWVEPVGNTPHTFEDVLNAQNNAGVVAALQAVCRNPDITVTYVAGNHDMLSFESQNRAIIANAFPGLNIVSDSPGLGTYSKNSVIWAEHGHRYCMFNAPDIWSRTNGHLPMGYFISRIAASKSAEDGQIYTTMDVLDMMIKDPDSFDGKLSGHDGVFSDEFIALLFDAVALTWGGFWPWDEYSMNGLDAFTEDPSVATVGETYDAIYSSWPTRMDVVSQYNAIWNDIGHLSSAANLLFEMPERIRDQYPFTPRIVLFGHTHKAAFYYHSDSVNSIYANTGTWIDGHAQTWVEIEITPDGDEDKYTVSLWYNGESTPRQQGTLSAPAATRRHVPFPQFLVE